MQALTMLTVDQVAQALDCGAATVEQALRAGDLPGVQLGRAWRIPESALAARLHEKSLQEAEARRRAANDPSGKPVRTAVLREVGKKGPPQLP